MERTTVPLREAFLAWVAEVMPQSAPTIFQSDSEAMIAHTNIREELQTNIHNDIRIRTAGCKNGKGRTDGSNLGYESG